jgi:hypothetical protein
MVVETTGGWCPSAIEFFKILVPRIALAKRITLSMAGSQMYQRLSCILQRANAISILRRLPRIEDWENHTNPAPRADAEPRTPRSHLPAPLPAHSDFAQLLFPAPLASVAPLPSARPITLPSSDSDNLNPMHQFISQVRGHVFPSNPLRSGSLAPPMHGPLAPSRSGPLAASSSGSLAPPMPGPLASSRWSSNQ